MQNLSPSAQSHQITVLINAESLPKEVPITSVNGPYDSVAESLPKCPIESDYSFNKCRISPQVGANYIRQWWSL
jgi:hypothetical protein